MLRLAYEDDSILYFGKVWESNTEELWGGISAIGDDQNTNQNRRNLIWSMVDGECTDDYSWVDDGGDDCGWYKDNE